jgi:hypothetical protein
VGSNTLHIKLHLLPCLYHMRGCTCTPFSTNCCPFWLLLNHNNSTTLVSYFFFLLFTTHHLHACVPAATAVSWALASQAQLLLLLAAYSFWLPQLLHNIQTTSKQPIQPSYILASSAARLLMPVYVFSCPDNMLTLPTQPWLVRALLLWVGAQVVLLLLQHYTHPHVLLPAALQPERYNYHRPEMPWQFRHLAAKASGCCSSEQVNQLALACRQPAAAVAAASGCQVAAGAVGSATAAAAAGQGWCGSQQQIAHASADCTLQCRACGGLSMQQAGGCWQQPRLQQQQQRYSCTRVTGIGQLPQQQCSCSWGLNNAAPQQQQQQLLLHSSGQCRSCNGSEYPGDRFTSSSSSSTNSSSDWRSSYAAGDGLLHDVVEGYDVITGEGVVECVICMGPASLMPLEGRVVTPCGHFYHRECLLQWMDVPLGGMGCPTCRWGPLPPL